MPVQSTACRFAHWAAAAWTAELDSFFLAFYHIASSLVQRHLTFSAFLCPIPRARVVWQRRDDDLFEGTLKRPVSSAITICLILYHKIDEWRFYLERSGTAAARAAFLQKEKAPASCLWSYMTLQTPQISQKAMPTSPKERLREFQRS